MRALCLGVIATLVLCAPATAQTNPACTYDVGAMMRLNAEAFDSTPGSGWRVVGDIEGCETAAAELIAQYRVNRIEAQRKSLLHHEAQLRAAAGQTEAALALLEQVRAQETAAEMLAYRDAEIAFLRNDRVALLAARERLLSIPPPDGFDASVARFRERFPDQKAPTWPLNIEVVDGFIACFGRPYREAYNTPCRRAP